MEKDIKMKTFHIIYSKRLEKPRELIAIVGEQHYDHKNGFEEIRIVTDKGYYSITSCNDCNALFVEEENK